MCFIVSVLDKIWITTIFLICDLVYSLLNSKDSWWCGRAFCQCVAFIG